MEIDDLRDLERVVEAGCTLDLPEAIQRLAEGPGEDVSDDVAEWVEVATAFATRVFELDKRAREQASSSSSDVALSALVILGEA
ncbi:hypothetical protein K1T35_47645 (plasmid) [Pseudonocardia sp. DSM 110487]|uniref:hypothetical protein n=1 Tax=Pseudonocardia sp. DSM 110487 TaxID=2865833 RepID=UPI001C69E6C5|nr:hypothetical protein [Pseudonocardia sp. DSM 110487]QYN41025.1 hypothetical protein K1T35_47645 [Pseudonocardia sp. DSM 110487]